jgi:glycerophosphoryl diester phosphodiesterase
VKLLTENKLDLDIYYKSLTRELADECHANGIKINVWTVNTPEEASVVIDYGVDFITTNILE